MGLPIIRVRFHATGPDGRQAGPVDVDVPITGSAPVAHTLIEEVDRVDVAQAWLTFDHPVSVDGAPELAFVIAGQSPIATFALADSIVVCVYADDFSSGDPWSLATLPTHVVAVPPIAVPQSGVVF